MIKFLLLVAGFAAFTLTACEGKKSLDGHPMDKPPPSAFAPRDSEPVLDGSNAKGTDTTGKDAVSK